MLTEVNATAPIQKTEERESDAPEILSRENVRTLIDHDPEVAHYNAAVIQSKNDEVLILLREVQLKDVQPGVPDKGKLLIYKATPEKPPEIVSQLVLPHPKVSHWEDARAFVSNKVVINDQGIESEKVSIGLTAIRDIDNRPVAATINGEIANGDFSVNQESLNVYFNDEGKNVTPISENLSLFRRNGDRHRHSLELVEHSQDENGQNKLNIIKNINFPEKSWCQWQIGTQAQLLPGGILPIHGVNRYVSGKDSQGNDIVRYSYSLGLARMDKDLNVIKVTDSPMFTRESFKNILAMGKELDPNKDVIYCCGYSIDNNIVKFVINIGDLMTVEVSKKLSELNTLLDQSETINSEQILY